MNLDNLDRSCTEQITQSLSASASVCKSKASHAEPGFCACVLASCLSPVSIHAAAIGASFRSACQFQIRLWRLSARYESVRARLQGVRTPAWLSAQSIKLSGVRVEIRLEVFAVNVVEPPVLPSAKSGNSSTSE